MLLCKTTIVALCAKKGKHKGSRIGKHFEGNIIRNRIEGILFVFLSNSVQKLARIGAFLYCADKCILFVFIPLLRSRFLS